MIRFVNLEGKLKYSRRQMAEIHFDIKPDSVGKLHVFCIFLCSRREEFVQVLYFLLIIYCVVNSRLLLWFLLCSSLFPFTSRVPFLNVFFIRFPFPKLPFFFLLQPNTGCVTHSVTSFSAQTSTSSL